MRKGFLVAALAALGCTGELSGGPGSASSGGPGAPNGSAGSGATVDPQNVPADCTDEQPSPRLLRQLTRGEYQRTLADLLGLVNPDISAIPPDREVRGFSNNVTVAFVDEQHLDAYTTVATALSYTFWSTMPDAALFAAAASGALATKSEVEAQARRLLADPRGRDNVAHFFYEWMESPRAYVAAKDELSFPRLFSSPGGIDNIRGAMRQEQDAFVEHVVFDSTRHFAELFDATYTFANADLAAYYGLPTAGLGATPQKVDLGAGSARGGLLTLGMFLFGHARTTASSPTQRGHMIRANLLCEDIPPPPPDVDTAVTPANPGRTSREQILALTASGSCPACHQLQDPIGFGLEAFDAVGVFRTEDNGVTVDATGEIKGITGPNGETLAFNGSRELSTIVGQNPKTKSCFTTNYYRFARGYDAKGVDVCAVNKLTKDFVTNDLEIPELFVRLALQDSLTTRRSAEVLEP